MMFILIFTIPASCLTNSAGSLFGCSRTKFLKSFLVSVQSGALLCFCCIHMYVLFFNRIIKTTKNGIKQQHLRATRNFLFSTSHIRLQLHFQCLLERSAGVGLEKFSKILPIGSTFLFDNFVRFHCEIRENDFVFQQLLFRLTLADSCLILSAFC